MEKATLEKLLERKLKKEKASYKEIEVPEIGMSFMVEKMSLTEFLRTMDGYKGQENSVVSNFEMFKELIYKSVPLFHDKKLQAQYECVEPYDIVAAVMDDNLGAISGLASKIINLYGLNSGEIEQEIKN